MAYIESTDWDRASVRKRGVGIAIALILEALLIIALLTLGARTAPPKFGNRGLSAFSLEAESSSASKSSTETAAPVTKETPRNVVPIIPKPLLPPVNPVTAPPPSPDFVKVSKADFDAMDLSKMPSNGGSGSGDAKGSGQGSKGMMGPGGGPGGAPLYPVAWYREPFHAELAPYLAAAKSVPPGASAEIACKMIEHYHVENCQILGENPRGTGLAKALRLAAWQFLVKPPRIGNKPQLGVWVRIRFNFTNPAPEATPDVSPDTP